MNPEQPDVDPRQAPMVRFECAHGTLWLRPGVIFAIYDAVDGCTVHTTLGQAYKIKHKADEAHARAFGTKSPRDVLT